MEPLIQAEVFFILLSRSDAPGGRASTAVAKSDICTLPFSVGKWPGAWSRRKTRLEQGLSEQHEQEFDGS
jgi:hypothetical protein